MISLLMETYSDVAPKAEQLVIDQLDRGERADGSLLPNYSPASVFHYGKPAGPMKLFDQGNFWEGITLVVDESGIEMIGRDEKTKMLQIRYGDDIIDMSEESLSILNERYAIFTLQKYLSAKLQLG